MDEIEEDHGTNRSVIFHIHLFRTSSFRYVRLLLILREHEIVQFDRRTIEVILVCIEYVRLIMFNCQQADNPFIELFENGRSDNCDIMSSTRKYYS